MATDKPLVLVDGSSYLFRAYHALPKLTTRTGFPTGAIRGVIGMLRKLAKDYPDSPIAVIFDAKGKTFRNELYPEYKANRPPMPDDLAPQIEPIHALIRAMGLPLLTIDGVEADDVIGTLAREATSRRRETVISTSDKDLAQLVSPHVTLVDTMSDTRLDRAGVMEKFNVTPERIVDLLALVGDPSDNIPGVPGVGPKTAAKWLDRYGSLEGVIAHANEIKGKAGENLRACLDRLELSKELATIRCDVELEQDLDELVPEAPDEAALREQYRQYEFQSWLEEMGDAGTSSGEDDARARGCRYEIILEREQLERWLEKLAEAELIAIDTETTSLDYMLAELVGFSFAVAPGEAAYLPVAHDYPGAPKQLSLADALRALKPILESDAAVKLGQNLKYDMNVLARYDVELNGVRFDTMLESYVLDSVAGRHNMDDLAARHLELRTTSYEEVAGKGAKQLGFNEVLIEKAADYAAEDADVALKLHRVLWPQLEATPSLREIFDSIEMPLVAVLSRMERAGALVDAELLARQSGELAERMEELAEHSWAIAGERFNLDSPRQLQKVLYEKLGLRVLRKTPGGAPSTAESVLQELALEHELPQAILDYRSLAKLKSTYTDKLPLQIKPSTGRIHTSYHQAVTATGRLSSSDPNLQNIPIRTAEGRRIRQAFIAGRGKRLVAADYSQIELRIMAHLSGDEGLKSAFEQELDIHSATAAEVFGGAVDTVTPEQRRSAKAINFGLIYGMSAYGLGRQLGLSRHLAQQYVDRYFARYPGVHRYMEGIREQARERGYVETVFGRRLYVPEINARNPQMRQAAERTAINAPMQGSAADIIKRAMISVDRWLQESDIDARMIMQVHDELILEVARDDVDRVSAGIRERMEQAAALDVPLVVDVGVGGNWDEAH